MAETEGEVSGAEPLKISPPTKGRGWKRVEIISHFTKDSTGKQTRKGLDFLITPEGGVVLSVSDGATKINLKLSIQELAHIKAMMEYMVGEMIYRQMAGGS